MAQNVIKKARKSVSYINSEIITSGSSFLVTSKIFGNFNLYNLLKVNFNLVLFPDFSKKVKSTEIELRTSVYPIVRYGKLSAFYPYKGGFGSWVKTIFILNGLSNESSIDVFSNSSDFYVDRIKGLRYRFACFTYYFFIFDFYYLVHYLDFCKFIKVLESNFYRFQLLPIVFMKYIFNKFVLVI